MTILIIAGVTAVGKTWTAKKLSTILNWDYIEADEYHSQENIAKMHAGIALTDEDRLPWLKLLHEQLIKHASIKRSCIITCSALKKIYREILITGLLVNNDEVTKSVDDFYLIILTLSEKELQERLLERQHVHFMNPNLLASQLDTLELPDDTTTEPNTYVVQCDGLSPDEVVSKIRRIIKQ